MTARGAAAVPDELAGKLLPVDVDRLRLLADPTRAAIVALLAAEQLCTSQLVSKVGAAQTNVSNHLRLMREAGLVTAEPAGRYTYYRLNPEPMAELANQLHGLAAAAHRSRRRPVT